MSTDPSHRSSLSLSLMVPWRQRHMINQLVRREVSGRYRGSLLGGLWSFVQPLMMLAVYTFVFSFVFKARWQGEMPTDGAAPAPFALVLFSGMVLHQWLAECLTRSPVVIIENANFVKKVIFPLEIFPYTILLTGAVHFLISFTILLAGIMVVGNPLSWVIISVPFILLPFMVMMLGFSWFLAATGVYVRDIGHLMGLLVTVLLFISPVFYPLEALPEALRPWLMLNPLTVIVQSLRDVLLWGRMPDWSLLASYSIVSVVTASIGFVWFQKTRKGFADVL